MAIGAGLPLSYADLSAALGINWYRGSLSATVSHTSGRYQSVKAATLVDSNGFTPTWSGDCLTGLSGIFQVTSSLHIPGSAAGQRFVGVAINPGATTWNSATAPAGIVAEPVQDAESDAYVTGVLPAIRIRLTSSDLLMWYGFQDSGSTLTIPTAATKSWLQIVKVGS